MLVAEYCSICDKKTLRKTDDCDCKKTAHNSEQEEKMIEKNQRYVCTCGRVYQPGYVCGWFIRPGYVCGWCIRDKDAEKSQCGLDRAGCPHRKKEEQDD